MVDRDAADVAEFFTVVAARLEAGAVEYADNPAERRPGAELARELEEEAADLAGWGFQAWRRARALRVRLAALERHATPIPIGRER